MTLQDIHPKLQSLIDSTQKYRKQQTLPEDKKTQNNVVQFSHLLIKIVHVLCLFHK